MGWKLKLCGTITYRDSYLENTFRHSKVFRLYAILHDAAGAVRAQSGKGSGYCYMIGRGTNSCVLGPVPALLLCLQVKLFPHSIFNSVDFWSNFSCLPLDIQLADKTVQRSSEFLFLGMFRDTYCVVQKSTYPQNKHLGVQEEFT